MAGVSDRSMSGQGAVVTSVSSEGVRTGLSSLWVLEKLQLSFS